MWKYSVWAVLVCCTANHEALPQVREIFTIETREKSVECEHQRELEEKQRLEKAQLATLPGGRKHLRQSQELRESHRRRRESQDVQSRVRLLANVRNSREQERLLREIVEEIQQKWLTEDSGRYARLMLDVVNNLTWLARSDSKQYRATTEKYAIETLEKGERIPANIEFDLLRYVRPAFDERQRPGGRVALIDGVPRYFPPEPDEGTVEVLDDSSLQQARGRKMLRWFDAWKRLEQAIDPDWDPEDLPFSRIAPPIATGLPSGAGPVAIQDAELRAEYEAAIEANRKKSEESKRQRMLRQVKRRFSSWMEKTIVTAYSRPPHDMNELAKFLRVYVEDQAMRGRILEAVQKNVSSK